MSAHPRAREILLAHHDYELAREASREQTCLVLAGDVDGAAAARVLEAADREASACALLHLDLGELELPDGVAVARMVDLVRLLLARAKRVRVLRAPQSLAHTLYRVGMLKGDARLELIEPRQEEGVAG